jgi:nucleoside-diphosphate-sugar epimerase
MWEDALAASRAGRVRVTEARASDFVGPESGGQAHLGDHLIPRVLAGKKVWVFGNADAPHSWSYVPDVARTLATLGTDDRSWGRAWLVPSNRPLTQREAVASIARAAGVPMPAVGVIRRPLLRAAGLVVPMARGFGEVLHQFERPFVIDASETAATFGIEPTSWETCVRTTLSAYTATDRVASRGPATV